MLRLRRLSVNAFQLGLAPGFQLIALILASKALGAANFGIFSVFQSTTMILAEVVGLGASEIMIRRMAVDKTPAREAFGAMLYTLLVSFIPVFLLYVAAALVLSRVGASSTAASSAFLIAALMFGFFDLLAGKLIVTIEHLAIAGDRMTLANLSRTLAPLFRCVLLGALYVGGAGMELPALFYIYSISTTAALLVSGAWAIRVFGWPRAPAARPSLLVGIAFSANQLVRALQGNADRLLLNLWMPASALGAYSISLRFIQAAILPISAVLRMSYRGMFEAGARGPAAILAYCRQVLPMMSLSIGLAVLAAVLFAPLAPRLLGTSFAGVPPIAASLALTPAFIGLGYLAGDVITGLGRQSRRVAFLIIAAVAQYATVFLLRDVAGIYAAVAGIYVFHTIFTAACWLTVSQVRRGAPAHDHAA